MRILLTGATGFIGSSLLHTIPGNVETIILTSDLSHKSYQSQNIEYIQCDMSDYSNIKDKINEKIDLCIHLAWAGNSGPKRADTKLQMNNVNASIELLNSLHSLGVKRFVGIGSIAEKDVINYHLSDGSTPNPVSTYGVSKLMARMLTKVKCNELGIEHIWCQLGNTYGTGHNPENFVNYTVKKLRSSDRASFTKGDQLYDLVFIDDTSKGIWIAATRGTPNCSYYIGSGHPRPLKDYILELRDLISPQKPIYLGDIPYNGVSLNYEDYDITPISLLGYHPSVSFDDGIKTIIENK